MRIDLSDIEAAQRVIIGQADATPMFASPFMTAAAGQPFWYKCELMQPIGAFKLRGAMNAVANLPEGTRGVTCCSTGNHGRGVAYAAAKAGLRAVICMSELVPGAKVEGIKALGAEVRIVGRSQDDAQIEVLRLVAEEGLAEISPFDDRHVIAGQGTIGLEMLAVCPELEAIYVPLSGGGLAAGVAIAAKALSPAIKVYGISMESGAAMYESLQAGAPVDVKEWPSLADSLGGGIGLNNRFSFALCQGLLDDVVLVSEAEIYHAMQVLFYEDRMVAEGGSVVALAAMLTGKLPKPQGPVATILSGRNADMAQVSRIMAGQSVMLGGVELKGRPYGT
ncbi:hydroxyectoine utilization dehydratase EutB [Lentibacter sp. XHP0401]|uniref:hydroxyectoine utilization dehydratase EutB n=1 Tax=Lentibacter sp. XHP0401 TaxID=2984334 RepID=UPI0021E91B40|nr:hydroxyectoine utilization dehydratase EutB [Lentibacter sp. XHP0401]MCV2894181.1 hydroxyectoine utilization dehydratase EutB [Lentibacter sp. XHP0401]